VAGEPYSRQSGDGEIAAIALGCREPDRRNHGPLAHF
jgi:hypothetical protein